MVAVSNRFGGPRAQEPTSKTVSSPYSRMRYLRMYTPTDSGIRDARRGCWNQPTRYQGSTLITPSLPFLHLPPSPRKAPCPQMTWRGSATWFTCCGFLPAPQCPSAQGLQTTLREATFGKSDHGYRAHLVLGWEIHKKMALLRM